MKHAKLIAALTGRTNGTPNVKGEQFDNWDEALAQANKLYNRGQITRAEIDQIARSAFADKQKRNPSPDDLARRKDHQKRVAAASSVTGAPGGGVEFEKPHNSIRDAIRSAMAGD